MSGDPARRRDSYTRYPRAILWLLREGDLTLPAPGDGRTTTVRLPAFYIGKTPITNLQFESFDPTYRRTASSPDDREPAAGISHRQATAYCRWYAEIARKPIRLPTELEWEYACRAGTTTRCFFGDDPQHADPFVWDSHNGNGMAGAPTAKRPNDFGLHGMLGGVWEWTATAFGPNIGPAVDEQAPDDAARVLRGGSFRTDRVDLSSGLRRAGDPSLTDDDIGFRIVREFTA